MIAQKGSGARCLASLRPHTRPGMQPVILYSFWDAPLCGTLLIYNLISVGLPLSISKFEEEQYCY